MTKNEVAKLARKLMDDHGLKHVPFKFSRAKTILGSCTHRRYRDGRTVVLHIKLSSVLLPFIDAAEIRDTILHEIAHALAGPKAGHGPKWKRIAREVGCRPETCAALDTATNRKINQKTSKYRADCVDNSQHQYYFNRMGKAWREGRKRCKCGGKLKVHQLQ